MAATEQQHYEMGTRIDHPVFPKDMSTETTADSPWNSIWNRLMARQFVKLQTAIDELALNAYPHTCDENTIDRWEDTYFGITKPSEDLAQRISELLIKINSRLTMSEPDVIKIAQAITGQTPTVIRSIWSRGWVIGASAIGKTTVIAAGSANSHSAVYVLYFDASINSKLKKLLDTTLTRIEKGGSRHSIVAPLRLWIIGRSAIGTDTTIGE